MPANPGGPQRRAPTRYWSALATPIGFERCVRETLRELYGYVALLTGRDRAAAESIVASVYRSLFRAAGAGVTDTVTLGALRSAARRAWLDAHHVELATTDEVSRAPASTIADLSPLERAVLVLRHVNGMSTDRAATELGRTEREVAAVGAHAVRRLRGTDDTSGAWLRAYLGPSITPAAGLVDRIVDRLAEVPAPPAPTAPPAAPEPDAPAAGPEPDPDIDPDAAPDTEAPDTEVPDTEVPDTELPGTPEIPAMETTEIAVVDRPTVELPTVTPVGDDHDHPAELVLTADEPAVTTGRPRWALVIGLVLLTALLIALIWLALRTDPDATVVSTPTSAAEAVEPTAAADAVGPTTAATPDPTTATSTPTSSTAAGRVEVGLDPACDERRGSEPASVDLGARFGPLAATAGLSVAVPESVDVAAEEPRSAARTDTVLRPDGLVVAVRPAETHRAVRTLVARVGLDGTLAWVRCLDGDVALAAAPDTGADLAVRASGDDWTALSVADGSLGDPIASLDRPADDDEGDGPELGFSHDGDLGRSVLAVLDDGRVLWTAPDLVLPRRGFRAVTVGDVVLAQHCEPGRTPDACASAELRAYALATGEPLWTRLGEHAVVAGDDGLALVGGMGAWELLDVTTATPLEGQRWDADAFDVGTDPERGHVHRTRGALVVARPGTVEVWFPAGAAGERATVALP